MLLCFVSGLVWLQYGRSEVVMSLIDVGDRKYNVQVMKDRPYHPDNQVDVGFF